MVDDKSRGLPEDGGSVEAGVAALNFGEYAGAFRILLPHAEAGNAEAQASVGLLCFLGLGVNRDFQEATRWLKEAAAKGRGEAAHNLGTLFLTCESEFPVNPAESRKYYLMAHDLGFIVASEEWYDQLRSC